MDVYDCYSPNRMLIEVQRILLHKQIRNYWRDKKQLKQDCFMIQIGFKRKKEGLPFP